MKKDKIALVSSFPVGTGIHRFDENVYEFGFYEKFFYFNFQKSRSRGIRNECGYEEITASIFPGNAKYIASMVIPTRWSKIIKRYDYTHITTPEFFHLSRFSESIIGTIHDIYPLVTGTKEDHSIYYRMAFKYEMELANKLLALTCISNVVREQVRSFFPKLKLKVIHHWCPKNFINIDRNTAREALHLPTSKFILMNVSADSGNKNIEMIQKIMENLDDNFLLIKLGGGEVRIKNRHRVLNITKFIDDETLVKFYNAADLYISTSFAEGFNYPIIEAINCGTPVMATDIPIFREVLKESPYILPFDTQRWVDEIKNMRCINELREAKEWYRSNIGDYYTYYRGKRDWETLYQSIGVNI